ncbi:MAG: T9SS type A sorting domain-containing protein [Ginsengibacter sp.]
MKKFLLSTCSFVFSIVVFSQTPCPTQFLRNNGNAGPCASHIRLYFNTCPTIIPTLDSIKINGVLQPEVFTLIEKKCNGNNTYVDYCISDDNLPPAARITVFLTYLNGSTGAIIGNSVCDVVSAGPTPVILSNFGIQRNNNNEVSATWQTQQEISSSRFEIERAYNNNSFQKIGTVLAAGSSNTRQSYLFSDKTNSSQNISFYRIKMIDKDGTFSYTETKSVKGYGTKTDFVVFPNPCHGNARITITELSEPTEVQLMDVSGRLVKSITLTTTSSTEINNLQKGSYFVRISGKISGETSVRKLSVIE